MSADIREVPDWLDVSRETIAKLDDFLNLVEKWNPRINLVSAGSLATGWSRHVLDSAQLFALAGAARGMWLDIGSGAGFPGIVISIIAEQQAPELDVVLVESDRRKAVFLSEAVRHLGLNAKIHCDRIENLAPVGAQIVSARALAALPDLLPMVVRHMVPEGHALFPKGQRYAAELAQCQQSWVMQHEVTVSKTDPDGAIVKVWNLHRV